MADEEKPAWHPVSIVSAPKLGNVYWCEFHHVDHVKLPEMWKTRPVVVVSHKGLILKGSCLVVPCTTEPQEVTSFSIEVPGYVADQFNGQKSWCLYNHLITVSTSRLQQVKGRVPRYKQEDLDALLACIREWLPKPLT